MDPRCLDRIDRFLLALGADPLPPPGYVRHVRSSSAVRFVPIPGPSVGIGAAPGVNPWRTEGIEARVPPTPAQDRLIDLLIEAQALLDPERMYVVDLAVCQARAYETNRRLPWAGSHLSVMDWYSKAWIATVEAAKLLKGYVPHPTADLASERWKESRAAEAELRPLVEQALVERESHLKEVAA